MAAAETREKTPARRPPVLCSHTARSRGRRPLLPLLFPSSRECAQRGGSWSSEEPIAAAELTISAAARAGIGEKSPTPPVEPTAPAGVLACRSRRGAMEVHSRETAAPNVQAVGAVYFEKNERGRGVDQRRRNAKSYQRRRNAKSDQRRRIHSNPTEHVLLCGDIVDENPLVRHRLAQRCLIVLGTFSKPVMRVAVFLGVAFAIYDGVHEMVHKQEPGSGEAKPRTSNCLSPPLPEGCDCNGDVCEAATHWRGGSDRRPLEAVVATAAALLDLEDKNTPSASSLESKLIFCNGDESFLSRNTKLNPPDKKPAISSFPQSQFLGKVKDFLGVISEANKNLELDAKTNLGKNHDIEALTGEEYEYIEMDLMLGGCAEKESEAEVARRRREGWRGRWR
nr:histone deacetylase HDT2 [Ipomoea batatas]